MEAGRELRAVTQHVGQLELALSAQWLWAGIILVCVNLRARSRVMVRTSHAFHVVDTNTYKLSIKFDAPLVLDAFGVIPRYLGSLRPTRLGVYKAWNTYPTLISSNMSIERATTSEAWLDEDTSLNTVDYAIANICLSEIALWIHLFSAIYLKQMQIVWAKLAS